MDLISAKVEAAKASKKSRKHCFIVVDAEGECAISEKHPGPKATIMATYLNGSEVATPAAPEEAVKKDVGPKTKTNKKMKAVKKGGKKISAKKADRKPVTGADVVKTRIAAGAKKQTLSIKKALELAKKGSTLYRASNGSDLGKYYLDGYKNKEKEIEFLVLAPAKA